MTWQVSTKCSGKKIHFVLLLSINIAAFQRKIKIQGKNEMTVKPTFDPLKLLKWALFETLVV